MASNPKILKVSNSPVLTLKNRADFLRLRKAKRVSGQYFTVQGAASNVANNQTRVGYTVTTRVGNAVERNRIKRRLREVVKQGFNDRKLHQKSAGFDYVVLARRSVLCGKFETLVKEFTLALDRLHANGSKGSRRTDKNSLMAKVL